MMAGMITQKVEAVGIYKPSDENKASILIVLHGQYDCCYPKIFWKTVYG